jgi:hypothetical protein
MHEQNLATEGMAYAETTTSSTKKLLYKATVAVLFPTMLHGNAQPAACCTAMPWLSKLQVALLHLLLCTPVLHCYVCCEKQQHSCSTACRDTLPLHARLLHKACAAVHTCGSS